jgi:hypothetical protein
MNFVMTKMVHPSVHLPHNSFWSFAYKHGGFQSCHNEFSVFIILAPCSPLSKHFMLKKPTILTNALYIMTTLSFSMLFSYQGHNPTQKLNITKTNIKLLLYLYISQKYPMLNFSNVYSLVVTWLYKTWLNVSLKMMIENKLVEIPKFTAWNYAKGNQWTCIF